MDLVPFLFKLVTFGLPIVLAITLHEAAHGFVALRCGDDTALKAGRISFNPLRHVDPMGTVIIPGLLLIAQSPFLFGYAKPVPVNFARLRNPRKDMILVAIAGPFTNFILAFASVCLFHTLDLMPTTWIPFWLEMLKTSLIVNVTLGIFNMLPLLPLDGGRVMMGLLPLRLARVFEKSERWGMFILIGCIIILPLIFLQFGITFNPVAALLGPLVHNTIEIIARMTGISP